MSAQPAYNPDLLILETLDLESLLTVSKSKRYEYTKDQLRFLQAKLEGNNVEWKTSLQRRQSLIIEFCRSWQDWLEVPTEDIEFESSLLRYEAEVQWADNNDTCLRNSAEYMQKPVFDAYVTLDFWSGRKVLKHEDTTGSNQLYIDMLDAAEKAFKDGVMPPVMRPLGFVPKYRQTAFGMVKFFRSVKNDRANECTAGETAILRAVQNTLRLYESSTENDHYGFFPHDGPTFRSLEISQICKAHIVDAYDIRGLPRMYKACLIIDMTRLDRRLKRNGASIGNRQLLSYVGHYLMHDGEFPEKFFDWLVEFMPPPQGNEENANARDVVPLEEAVISRQEPEPGYEPIPECEAVASQQEPEFESIPEYEAIPSQQESEPEPEPEPIPEHETVPSRHELSPERILVIESDFVPERQPLPAQPRQSLPAQPRQSLPERILECESNFVTRRQPLPAQPRQSHAQNLPIMPEEAPPVYDKDLENFRKLPILDMQAAVKEVLIANNAEELAKRSHSLGELESNLKEKIQSTEEHRRALMGALERVQIMARVMRR